MFKSSFVAAAIATVAGALVFACGSSSSSSSDGNDTTDNVDGSTSATDHDSSTTGTGGNDGSTTGDDSNGDGGTQGTGDSDGSITIHSEITEQSNSMCPTSPTIATGTGAPGAACKTAYDCAPVCCACGTIDAGTGNWLAASCQGTGQCSQATACADSVPSGGFHCSAGVGDASTD